MANEGYIWGAGDFAVKAEGTEGTAEALTKAEATMLVIEPDWQPQIPVQEMPGINERHAGYTAVPHGPQTADMSIMCPMKGSGVVGTAPAIDPLLESAGLLGVNDAGVSEIYKDTIRGTSVSAQLVLAKDVTQGLKHLIHGARSNLEMTLNANEPPMAKFDLRGAYNVPVDVSLLDDVAYESTRAVSNTGGVFTLAAQVLRFTTFTIRIENTLKVRPVVAAGVTSGVYSVIITEQKIRGSIEFETVDPDTWDSMTVLTGGTEMALSLPITGATGSVITITAPKLQFTGPGRGNDDGLVTDTFDFILNRSGNTSPYAISIAFT